MGNDGDADEEEVYDHAAGNDGDADEEEVSPANWTPQEAFALGFEQHVAHAVRMAVRTEECFEWIQDEGNPGAWRIKKGCEMQFVEEYNRWVGGSTKLLNLSKGLKNNKGIEPYLPDGYKISPRYSYCFSEEVMVKFFR